MPQPTAHPLDALRQAVASLRDVPAKQIELEEVSATDARNEFAHMLETASRRGVVVIHKQNAPKAVLLSFDEFSALVTRPARTLDTLSAEFDAMLARMQAPAARAGMKAAFDAVPGDEAETASAARANARASARARTKTPARAAAKTLARASPRPPVKTPATAPARTPKNGAG